jgi:hypothetical protein
MVDLPLPEHEAPTRWRAGPRITPVLLKRAAALVLAFLIALGWSAVLTEYAQRKCDSPLGRLAVRLKLDSYYSNCQCMTHSLDFSDPCNSMYIPLLL